MPGGVLPILTWSRRLLPSEYGRQFDGSLLAALLYAVVMSPLAVFSTVVNGIPALLVQLGARNLASEGFAGSFRLAGTILLFPLFQLLWGIGVGPILFRHYGILPMLCFFAALVLSHSFSFRYYWNLKFLVRRVRNLLHKDELTDAIADALRGLFRKMQENGERSRTEGLIFYHCNQSECQITIST